MKTTGTRIVGGTAVALAALLLSGCGGNNDTASPEHVNGTAAPATGDASQSASPESSGTPSASASSPGGGTKSDGGQSEESASSGGGNETKQHTSSRCHTGDLKATVGPNHPGAGQENYALVLTNTSGSTCTVYGYPGAAFVNSKGQNVSINPHREGGNKQTIKLSPGESAWSALSYSNPQMTGVATVDPDAILITPPDEKKSLKVNWTGSEVTRSGAASVASVSPLRPGNGS